MEEFGELVTAGVVALATASFAQFGVELERAPEPRPRPAAHSTRRVQRTDRVAVVAPHALRSV